MKIGLGAVQFGVDYGISNKNGKTPVAEVVSILDAAGELGVKVIDTACLYGDSEDVLGRAMPIDFQFDIITKTPQFTGQSLNDTDAQQLEDTFRTSLLKLNRPAVYGLLIHRVDDLFLPGGQLLMDRLLKLKQQGLVEKIGVSVYTGLQIDQVLDLFSIDLIQLPINVFDQRLLQSGHLQKLKSASVLIHARSVFLQGLLLMGLQEIPVYFDTIREKLESYHAFIKASELTPLKAALGFVASLPEIDHIICGVNNVQQLREIGMASQTQINWKDFKHFAILDESVVNPAHWRLG